MLIDWYSLHNQSIPSTKQKLQCIYLCQLTYLHLFYVLTIRTLINKIDKSSNPGW